MPGRPQTRDIRIGGGSGYWGESEMGLPQLLKAGVDYVVFDYLAEITMSILARARTQSPDAGYATDFVESVIRKNIRLVAETGVKLLANAGGVNPQACAAAIREIIEAEGLDIRVATVLGDDLTERAPEFGDKVEMFSGEAFPERDSIASMNAYLGAFPIAAALDAGAQIVITGRCVDSALTLAACIHEFGWTRTDWDLLSAGSLAGHLLECGPQVCGGNFTDWQEVDATLADAGYPIATLRADGCMVIGKPEGTGGAVTCGTVAEQLVYEIGDPRAYLLPDVTCDFGGVALKQTGADRVEVTGALGRAPSRDYKVSTTFRDGYKISTLWYFIGEEASAKASSFARAMLTRAERTLASANLGGYSEIAVETIGDESHYGAFSRSANTREVALKVAAKHPDPKALRVLLKEGSGLALAAPPGLALYTGGRPSPSPVIRLFSFAVSKADVPVRVELDGADIGYCESAVEDMAATVGDAPVPAMAEDAGRKVSVPLRRVAWGRSGDKGNKANIGIIPRDPAFSPWIWQQVTTEVVKERFAHFLEGDVERFFMPGTGATNFLLHDVLGGGGMASLRNDPQGKSYAQILLDMPVELPCSLLEEDRNAGV